MSSDLLITAIKKAGSEEKLGKEIGFSQHAIWRAKKRGQVSPLMAAKIDDWSGGFISKHDLRPDIFGERPKARKGRDAA